MRRLAWLLLATSATITAFTAQDVEQLKKSLEKQSEIKISELGNLPTTLIPAPMLQGLIVTDVTIEDKVPGFEHGLIVRGKASIKDIEVQVRLLVVEHENTRGISIGLFFPSFPKLLTIIPQLSFMKDLSLLDPRLILSSFDYQDQELQTYLLEGLNITAAVEFKGPFNWLGTLIKNKAKLGDSFVLEANRDIVLTGYIDKKFSDSSFNIALPIRIGVDLTKIKEVPESVSDVIQRITTSDMKAAIIPPPDAVFSLGAGMMIKLGTQERPLSIDMTGGLSDQTSYVRGTITQVDFKWFALEDVGVQINWDSATMPAAAIIGLPFTGIELQGTLALGKASKKRAAITLGGKASMEGDALSGLAFLGEAKNIKVSDFIHYIADQVKRPLTKEELPEINFKELKLSLAAKDTFVAGVRYSEGLKAIGKITFWGKDGELTLIFQPTKLLAKGIGYIQNIDAKVFKISGAGLDEKAGTADDGPVIKIIGSATEIDRSGVFIDGQFVVPALGISQNTQLEARVTGLHGRFQTKVSDAFLSDFKVSIDKNFDELLLEYTFKQDFIDYLTQHMRDDIVELKKEAEKKLKEADKQIQRADRALASAREKATGGVSQEMQKADEKIQHLKQEIDTLKREHGDKCTGFNAIKNAGECIKISAEITAKGAELAAEETYRATLKPGKKVVEGIIGVGKTATEELQKSELTQKLTRGSLDVLEHIFTGLAQGARLFQLKKAYGRISGKEILEGRLATISLDIEIDIPEPKFQQRIILENMAIDFKDIEKSTKKIANEVVQKIKQKVL